MCRALFGVRFWSCFVGVVAMRLMVRLVFLISGFVGVWVFRLYLFGLVWGCSVVCVVVSLVVSFLVLLLVLCMVVVVVLFWRLFPCDGGCGVFLDGCSVHFAVCLGVVVLGVCWCWCCGVVVCVFGVFGGLCCGLMGWFFGLLGLNMVS